MIVYGDPSYSGSLAEFTDRFIKMKASQEDLRALLIEAGMLEQAAEDAGVGKPYRRITDALAEAFLGVKGEVPALPKVDADVTIKMPEGFAFYGLYPESYAAAADEWRQGHDHDGATVAVIGIRSIGTTLSAVVLTALRRLGVSAFRLTVRPTGHPFAREACLSSEALAGATHAIIVDEGPGLSGSSMTAVAEAVHAAGIPRDHIAFFPGHGNDPGGMASDEVRRWWRETPRYVVGTETLRWAGRTLEETLADHAGDALGIEELTHGCWRTKVFKDESEWPAVALPFERRKLLVTRSDGSRVLYKFVGLTEPETVLGFAAFSWVEGVPLTLHDASPELIARIGCHIEAVAGPPPSKEEAEKAQERLKTMLRINADEGGLSPLPSFPKEPVPENEPSAGDYRLAPWEWRLAGGEIVKVGRIAPTLDHTVVGRQPLAWDVAGAMVEWGLDDPAGLPTVTNLRFYRAAYAAFRMGQCLIFAGSDAEGTRLGREAAFYRRALERVLVIP